MKDQTLLFGLFLFISLSQISWNRTRIGQIKRTITDFKVSSCNDNSYLVKKHTNIIGKRLNMSLGICEKNEYKKACGGEKKNITFGAHL